MAFFLSEVEIQVANEYQGFCVVSALTRLRISSQPRRIALPAPLPRYGSPATDVAILTWKRVESFVLRRGEIRFNSEDVAAMRVGMHTSGLERQPKHSFTELTEEGELQRLRAFDFKVHPTVLFDLSGHAVGAQIDNKEERRQKLTDIVEVLWRKDRRRREEGSTGEAEAEDHEETKEEDEF